ncbi:hypothetical protein B7486_73430, partial [cyanobacterium TDX16]
LLEEVEEVEDLHRGAVGRPTGHQVLRAPPVALAEELERHAEQAAPRRLAVGEAVRPGDALDGSAALGAVLPRPDREQAHHHEHDAQRAPDQHLHVLPSARAGAEGAFSRRSRAEVDAPYLPVGRLARMDDRSLLDALTSDAERLVERHLSTTKEWFPHELTPWERGAELRDAAGDWQPELAVDPAVRSAVFVNLLTEDNLP